MHAIVYACKYIYIYYIGSYLTVYSFWNLLVHEIFTNIFLGTTSVIIINAWLNKININYFPM